MQGYPSGGHVKKDKMCFVVSVFPAPDLIEAAYAFYSLIRKLATKQSRIADQTILPNFLILLDRKLFSV